MFKTESAQIECDTCGRPTRHQRNIRYPNHILHLLLSIFTAGIWLPVWIVLSVSPKKEPWCCAVCGEFPEVADEDFWVKIVLLIVIGLPLATFLFVLLK